MGARAWVSLGLAVHRPNGRDGDEVGSCRCEARLAGEADGSPRGSPISRRFLPGVILGADATAYLRLTELALASDPGGQCFG